MTLLISRAGLRLRARFLRVVVLHSMSLLLFANAACAQAGTLDLAFNTGDVGNGDGANNTVTSVLALPGGKTMVAGSFLQFNGISRRGLVRLLADGTVDNTFATATQATGISVMAAQSDGRLLIAGSFSNYNGTTIRFLARLNTDGTLDNSFLSGTGPNNSVTGMVVGSNDKIYLVGNFTQYNGVPRNRIAVLNNDGTLDLSFDPLGGLNNLVSAVALQGDGKILAAGNFTTYNGASATRIVRVNADGTMDGTFSAGTGFNLSAGTIAWRPDGSIIVGGSFSSYKGATANRLVKLDASGNLDATFATNIGSGPISAVNSIGLRADGALYVSGGFTAFNGVTSGRIVCLAPDGQLQPGFASGTGFQNTVNSISVQADGKLVAGGMFFSYQNRFASRVARVNGDGSIDAQFNATTGASSTVNAVAQQSDGKYLIAGLFSYYNGQEFERIVRTDASGAADPSFATGAGFNNTVRTVLQQPDGKILVGGDFTTYNGIPANRIIRLNSDGSADAAFLLPGGTDHNVHSIRLCADGKIIVAGNFSNYGGVATSRLIRLNSDGTLDNTFQAPAIDNVVQVVAIQSDGKVLAGGDFTSPATRLFRVNSDGSFDNSLNTGFGFDFTVDALAQQADGKLLVGGGFSSYDVESIGFLVRLNANGTRDQTFNPGLDSWVYAIAVQPDTKILLGGVFGNAGGAASKGIARLEASGVADASFTIGSGITGDVRSLQLLSDNKILAGGGFVGYNGVRRNRVLRLLGDPGGQTIVPGTMPAQICGGAALSIPFTVSGTFTTGNVFTAQLSDASGSFASPVSIGTLSGTGAGTITTSIPAGTGAGSGYLVRIVASIPAVTGTPGSAFTINAAPLATSFSYTGSPYCTSTGTGNVFFSGSTGGSFSAAPAGLVLNAGTGSVNIGSSAAGSYVVTYSVTAGACPVSTTAPVVIRPDLGTVTGNRLVCGGSTTSPIGFNPAPGLTFNWTNDNPAIGLASNGSGDLPPFAAVNNGSTNALANIRAVPSGGTGCSASVNVFRITVKPEPRVDAVPNQAFCVGGTSAAINFTGFAAVYSWTNNNTSVGLIGAGSGNIAAFQPTQAGVASITVTPVAAGCSGLSRTFTITSSPSAGTLRYPQPSYCRIPGTAVPISTGSTGGLYLSSPSGLSIHPVTGVIDIGGSQAGFYLVRYVVSGLASCSAEAWAPVEIKALEVITPLGNQNYCSGIVTSAIPFTGSSGIYTWTNDNPSIGLAASGTGNSLPSFTTVNAGPGVAYAYVHVTALGTLNTCESKAMCFRIAVNPCGPVTQSGGTQSDPATMRAALAAQFEAGPNPARSNVLLRYTGAEQSPFTVQLLSQYGQPVGRVFSFTGTTYTLDLSNVTPGAYSLQVTHVKSGVVFNKQVIKL
ncbi:hypothetical protein [Flaviaesturariibacter aridisoli]|uniref:T9SS type A sorting domain-containing protein n=1 Tax=Flaviaesturariibacter aridisoli TaxID=2545761 RepID=A0A4R4E5K3_9BACT|nr:hypothetical protein [Flaviaesturariibacter aridisoli]TCZ74759.1 hypothetical protein E0486_00195 [Flaviaesturariibacter aridisoli]